VSRDRTLKFIAFMAREIPGFGIAYKDDPPESMRLRDRCLHWLARRVNSDYDQRYTTVLYPIIYLPSGTRRSFEEAPEKYYTTLRHEFVHLKDFQRYHIWMAFSYVFVLPVGWTMRAFWELRGYAQNLICWQEDYGRVPDSEVERLADIFSGRGYVYMLLPRSWAHSVLKSLQRSVEEGRLSGVYPYGDLDWPLE